jgi:hypothetical protein
MIKSLVGWWRSIVDLKWYQKFIYWTIMFWIVLIFLIMFAISKVLFWIVVGLVVVVYFYFRFQVFLSMIRWRNLMRSNIFIFGAKGNGKDQIIQIGVRFLYGKTNLFERIFNRGQKSYLTNIKDGFHYGYGGRYEKPSRVFSLAPNTYKNLILDDVVLLNKNEDYEGRNYILSDASTLFPSHEDTELKKAYPSFALYYALSRQLYDMNIVVNTQVGGRLWKLLREQVQDGYVEALGTHGYSWFWQSIPFLRNYVVVSARYYKNLESAENGLLPFSKIAIANRVLDKTIYMTTAGATKEQYFATHGKIYDFKVFMKRQYSLYDTRYFETVFFGERKKSDENEKST